MFFFFLIFWNVQLKHLIFLNKIIFMCILVSLAYYFWWCYNLTMLDKHNSPQWYDIVHFEYKLDSFFF